jgi:4-hydroxybenzoate polyprenyltransferase
MQQPMQKTETSKVDLQLDSFIMRIVPEHYKAYALLGRFDRPVGVWLLALPGLWSIWISMDGFEIRAVWLSLLFVVGAFAMRAAGCVINDIWDRDLDKKVERTSVRPLAAEDLSLKQAAGFLALLLLIGFIVLMQMNAVTIILGLVSVPLIIAYPLMKRITFWPQAFLGITFNFGVLMGWSAMTETLEVSTFLLYAGAILWTLGYDTIYAHQDIEDDMRVGIKSTALRFGDASKAWVAGFYGAAFFLILLAFAMQSVWAVFALVPVAWHLTYQIFNWDMSDAQSSLKIFKSNRDTGLLILVAAFVAMIAGLF